MNTIWFTVPTWIALAAALIAALGLWMENRLTKFTVSANLLVRLEDKFDEPAMIAKRKRAAQALLGGQDLDRTREVLYFFELLGILVQKGALDPDLIYNEFSYWAISYWFADQKYIDEFRRTDASWFCAYAALVDRMNGGAHRKQPYLPTAAELHKFLHDECELVTC